MSQMSQRPPSQIRFKINVINFLKSLPRLINQTNVKLERLGMKLCTQEGNISLAGLYAESADPDAMITKFIDDSYQYWDNIINKNVEFFSHDMNKIFDGIPIGNMAELFEYSKIKDIDGSFIVDPTHIENVWKSMISFVKISISYCHKNKLNIDYHKYVQVLNIDLSKAD